MVVADLHVHTTNSDGILELADVPAAARDAGLSAVAITDHDRLHPDIDAPVLAVDPAAAEPIADAAEPATGTVDSAGVGTEESTGAGADESTGTAGSTAPLTLIHGIELRVDAGDQRVDLLGYGARPTDALEAEIDRLQRDRAARGRAIVERVEDRLGVDLPIAPERGTGRPDIARAVVASEADYETLDAVFADLIGNDGPCYVARELPDFERGRDVLADACAVVGLAHPLRYSDPEAALALAAGLDAVEVHYPYDGSRGHAAATGDLDVEAVERAADRHDLLATGGSDAHDGSLGGTGLSGAEYERFREALRR